MSMRTAASLLLATPGQPFGVTNLGRCSASNGRRPLMVAATAFLPVGIAHGIEVRFGGWRAGEFFFTARQRLMWFNDDPRTSHADVMALFDKAIDNLASKVPAYVSA